jgi:hypothetical protein
MAECAKPIAREKLKKGFLMTLPTGVYIISGVLNANLKPVYAEHVSPRKQRDEQWQEIVRVSVNQRLCEIFEIKELADTEIEARVEAWRRGDAR